MKQPSLAEKIIMMSLEGIVMGIYSAIRIFISLILRLLLGSSEFALCEQSNNVALRLSDTTKIKVGKSQTGVEAADFDNDKFVDRAAASETESRAAILPSSARAGFTEAKGSPLFAGLLPNDISVLCRYWCSNKFDCIIVL
jgi:hypothetical protein